eukprot:306775_1
MKRKLKIFEFDSLTIMVNLSANAIFGTLVSIISNVSIVLMLINIIRHTYPEKRTMRCRFYMNVSIFIFYLLFCATQSVISIYSLISSVTHSFYVPWCQLRLHEMYGFIIAKILLYQFYIYQFHVTFKDSSFGIPIRRLKCMGIIVSIPIIALTVISFMVALKPAQYLSDTRNTAQWHQENINGFSECSLIYKEYYESIPLLFSLFNVVTMVYVFNEIAFSIVILRLFLSRTLLLTLRLTKSESIESGAAHLTIKTTNLIILSVVTNYLLFIKYALSLDASVYVIDAFFNCLSIFLSYKFAAPLYNLIYRPCHKTCYGMCLNLCVCCCLPKSLPPDQHDKVIQLTTTVATDTEHTSTAMTRSTMETTSTNATSNSTNATSKSTNATPNTSTEDA